jgi:xylulokinase
MITLTILHDAAINAGGLVFLGIDLGTSGVKVAAVDEQGHVAAQGSAALGLRRPHPLWSEQDPEDWWAAAAVAVRALPRDVRRAVRGVGLSGQMHGAVLLDDRSQVLRPAILWNDGRSVRQCLELERLEPRSRAITGNLAMPGFTAPKLLWVREHEPDVFARTATVLLPKDYLRLRLTGEKISDMSDAAGTLWLDVERRAWSEAMLQATGLTPAHMPSLVEGTQPAGSLRADIAAQWGLRPVTVAGGGGDNAASAVGLGVISPGQAFLSLGTSGVLFVVTDRFKPNADRAAHAFCHALPERWHQMAVMLSAAAALDWAAGLAGFAQVPAAAQAAAARGLGRHTPLFLPYLSGERTPHNDALARGVFFGLSADTGPADLVVAALEGVALAFADGLDTLIQSGGNPLDLSAVGGGSRLDYWLTLIASALGHPLSRRSGGEAGAALGAARLARIAVTGEDPLTVCAVPAIERVFAPEPGLADLLRHRRGLFQRLYTDLKPAFREFTA